MIRHLGLRDYLRVLESVSRDVELSPALFARAKDALDPPAGERRATPARGDALIAGLEAQAAALCCSLLTRAPSARDAGKIAFCCLEEFLSINSARWSADATITTLRFDGVVRDNSEAAELFGWIAGNIRRVPRPRLRLNGRARSRRTRAGVSSAQDPLPMPEDERRNHLVIYLAGPFTDLTPKARDHLVAINHAVKAGLEDARRRLAVSIEFRLIHPSLDLPDGPAEDTWPYNSREIVEGADGLILVDVGPHRAGLGAAFELDLFALQDGPAAYFQSGACGRHSNYLPGRLTELDLETFTYEQVGELKKLASDWACRRAGAMETGWLRRDDRSILYKPLFNQLVVAWRESTQEKRERAADAAGMTVEGVRRMLVSVTRTATAPTHRVDSLCRSLGISRESSWEEPAPQRTQGRLSFDALLQAGCANAWGAEQMHRLWREAKAREERPHSYAVRRRMVTPEDWVRLHGETFL